MNPNKEKEIVFLITL